MGARLDNTAFFEYHDLLSRRHGGEAVGNDQGCATGKEGLQRLADEGFAFGVEGAGGFVEYEEVGLEQECAGDADALALAAAEEGAAVADGGVVGLGQLLYEIMCLGHTGGLDYLLAGGTGGSVGNIVADGVVEEEGVLVDHPYMLAQRVCGKRLNGLAINEYLA